MKRHLRNPLVLACAFFLAVTVVLTFPISLHPDLAPVDSSFPFFGDVLLNLWILGWDAHALTTGALRSLFDANIFFPQPSTLAYSEHLLGLSLLASPFLPWTDHPIRVYNALFLLGFFLSGLGTFLLVRRLAGSTLGGLVAGVVFAFAPCKFAQMGRLQLVSTQWIPLCLFFLHRAFEERRRRDLLLFFLFLDLQILSCWYYALFLAIALAWIGPVLVIRNRRTIRSFPFVWAALAAAAVGATGFALAVPYQRVRAAQGFSRSLGETAVFSARPLDYLVAPRENLVWGRASATLRDENPRDHSLFPGLTATLLALSLLVPRLGRGREDRVRGRPAAATTALACYLPAGVIAFVFSLGPVLGWRPIDLGPGGALPAGLVSLPYRLLFEEVPFLASIRVPSRFAVMVELSLAVAAGFGASRLAGPLARSRSGRLAGALLLALVVVESVSIPLPARRIPALGESPGIYEWLARQPGSGAIAEWPLPRDMVAAYGETERMVFSMTHWRPMVNGYSGFFPRSYLFLLDAARSAEPQPFLRLLSHWGVEWLTVYRPLTRRSWREAFDDLLERRHEQGRSIVYRLPPDDEPRSIPCPPEPLPASGWRAEASAANGTIDLLSDGSRETIWSAGIPQSKGMEIRLDFERETEVCGLDLWMGAAVNAYPRGLVVESPSRRGAARWRRIFSTDRPRGLIPFGDFALEPYDRPIALRFGPVRTHALRLELNVDWPENSWDLAELDVRGRWLEESGRTSSGRVSGEGDLGEEDGEVR